MTFLTKAELYDRMEDFRRDTGVVGPLDPVELAGRLGIKVSVYPFDSKRFSGALLRGANHSEIIISASRSPEGRRFTAAHELVHWYLHAGATFWCSDTKPTALEWQANAGAAELLMPYRLVLPVVMNIRSLYIADRAAAVKLVAERFGVSPSAAAARLGELSPELAQYLAGAPLEMVQVRSGEARAPGIDL